MTASLALFILLAYFGVLILISYFTTRKSDSETFFTANRSSPWYLVAFGMVGTSLSGVTFISIPGEVGNSNWSYLAVVAGNCIGYVVIALVLLPLYYKLNLVSIYSWLSIRFGEQARKAGSLFFILSQLVGASFRLFLVVGVLQLAFFNSIGMPFALTVFITIGLVWIYTFRGGIKTIVWTDTLQTIFMLASVGVTVYIICKSMDLNVLSAASLIGESRFSDIFDFDWRSQHNTIKQFLAGIAITIAINGLDQNIMQKNLTCRTLKDCRINMFSFSFLFFITNILFLVLGALLYLYADAFNIALPAGSDQVFPYLSLNYFGIFAGILFLLGIVAAAYSSVDSSLTALTTSFCIDFLKVNPKNAGQNKTRIMVHLGFSLLMCLIIILFEQLNNTSVVNAVFKAVGYTYGPILGLFAFGLMTSYQVKNKYILWICCLSPVLSILINTFSEQFLFGYRFGFEILLLNGLICFLGLFVISDKKT